MKKDPWIAFTLGVALHILSIPISFSMPETLNVRQCSQTIIRRRDSSSSRYRPTSPDKIKSTRIARTVQSFSFALKQYSQILYHDWRVLVIASVYVGLPSLLACQRSAPILIPSLVLASSYGRRAPRFPASPVHPPAILPPDIYVCASSVFAKFPFVPGPTLPVTVSLHKALDTLS